MNDQLTVSMNSLMESVRNMPPEERARRERDFNESERRRKEARIAMILEKSSMPERHRMLTPERTGDWGSKLTTLELRLGKGFFIALCGIRGNGKTQLACEMMKTRAIQGGSVLFTSAIGIFMAIKATYKKEAKETEEMALASYRRPDLLVIDEIGQRGQTPWENNLLFELLNQRYNDMSDTLLTCNLTPEEFDASLGPSLISRLNETGGKVECNWPSFRK